MSATQATTTTNKSNSFFSWAGSILPGLNNLQLPFVSAGTSLPRSGVKAEQTAGGFLSSLNKLRLPFATVDRSSAQAEVNRNSAQAVEVKVGTNPQRLGKGSAIAMGICSALGFAGSALGLKLLFGGGFFIPAGTAIFLSVCLASTIFLSAALAYLAFKTWTGATPGR